MVNTIADIKHAAHINGSYFFSHVTMKHWNSRVLSGVYGHRYFVTSETDYRGNNRRYTVREYVDGAINTVGEFRDYPTAYLARKEAARLASARIKHADDFCPIYNDVALPDEDNHCSLCGAMLLAQ